MRGTGFLTFACCCTLAGAMLCALPAAAQSAGRTIFIDLSAQGAAAAAPKTQTGATGSFDITSSVASAQPPAPVRATRTRFVDLTTTQGDPALLPQIEVIAATGQFAEDEAFDPYESFNRRRFESHVGLRRNVIDPVERVYTGVVPEIFRNGLHNVLTNLESPVIFTNDVLQGAIPRGMGTVFRFALNSTVGIAGIIDVARHVGLPFRDNDFGATLANLGVGEYPYLMVPLIGPSNPRDLAGKLVDTVIDPLNLVTLPGGVFTSFGHTAASQLDSRSRNIGELDTLTKTVPDPYAVYRRDARERRNAQLGEKNIQPWDRIPNSYLTPSPPLAEAIRP